MGNRRPWVPLKHVAEVWFSNVDKKSVDGQTPVRLCNYTDVYYNERIVAGMQFMEATATPEQVTRFSLRAGDVLLTKDSETADDIGVSALVAEALPGVLCGYHLAIARPRIDSIDGRFLRWALAASTSRGQLEVAATGVTRFGLRQDAVARMLVPHPDMATQLAIADLLDAETARIDAVVSSRARMLALLDERLAANIDAMLMHVPRRSLGRCLERIEQGWSPVAADATRADASSWAVLRLSAVTGGTFRPDQHKALEMDPGAYSCHEVQAGDLLMTRANTPELVGDVAFVADTPPRLLMPDIVYRLRYSRDRADGRYLSYALRTPEVRGQVAAVARGSSQSMVKLRADDIKALLVPLPALGDQQALAQSMAYGARRHSAQRRVLQRQIDLLRERRQALITAAVAGQLEIPSVAA